MQHERKCTKLRKPRDDFKYMGAQEVPGTVREYE